jgi:hypothetical protein
MRPGTTHRCLPAVRRLSELLRRESERGSPRLNGYPVVMGERDAAQAAILIRALSDVRDKMISRVTWLERHGAQSEAARLRRDINEAQAHINGLQRRYLGVDQAVGRLRQNRAVAEPRRDDFPSNEDHRPAIARMARG